MNQRTKKILLHLGVVTCISLWISFGWNSYFEAQRNNFQKVIDTQDKMLYTKDKEIKIKDLQINNLSSQLKNDEELLSECPTWIPVEMELSFYTISEEECGNADGITSSGNPATVGRTIASNTLPQGTKVKIDGHIYTVEDTGGEIVNNCLDILVSTKEEALTRGRYKTIVYVLK